MDDNGCDDPTEKPTLPRTPGPDRRPLPGPGKSGAWRYAPARGEALGGGMVARRSTIRHAEDGCGDHVAGRPALYAGHHRRARLPRRDRQPDLSPLLEGARPLAAAVQRERSRLLREARRPGPPSVDRNLFAQQRRRLILRDLG